MIQFGGTCLEKQVGFGRESSEKRKIIHGISLFSIHRCTSYDVWIINVNVKYDGLMRSKSDILMRLK